MSKNNIIEIDQGMWDTLLSYKQSIEFYERANNPVYSKALDKEKERYKYLKKSVLAN
jgi:hypothetical protein